METVKVPSEIKYYFPDSVKKCVGKLTETVFLKRKILNG